MPVSGINTYASCVTAERVSFSIGGSILMQKAFKNAFGSFD